MAATLKMLTHNLSDKGHETIEIYPISDMHVSREFNEGPIVTCCQGEIAEQGQPIRHPGRRFV